MQCNHSLAQCVHYVPIFKNLSDHLLTGIKQYLTSLHLAKNEFVYQEGDLANKLYIVNSGQIHIFRLSEDGHEQLVRILKPGDFIGEWDIFDNEDTFHQDFAQAIKPTNLCVLEQQHFSSFLLNNPSVAINIIREMAHRLNQADQMLLTMSSQEVMDRLVYYLLSIKDQSSIIHLPMSRKDLASYLGTSPETLSRRFKKLVQNKIIQVHKPTMIEIINLQQLQNYLDN
ncbi:Crp/Fnr family transcriptional regulator [Staphylococcus simiae]|uniref:Crp/Fnr family transcriptional regulator n=1 Tax=Staphylococcus simiae TaxID=308354 RepID=UPI001A97C0E4|nr:Crp/Fnr family transcriptional regulator [Staphylococcus simiae]MBO1199851.1 Crp/Fnr family transcriptional regulator [Staphylococcus simiae]MBO1202224.1 Crp/Fnr family transcriptional regulator [Staphylococcus simiae]MBO1204487.1 Crp/Fnr family transcriptional regulator [Staphylococcus simiae]MBO1211910.1 Crp/Fnr family transcriptional regulator [Staphylococcus simiae]MBO1230672.1 Crp/Fnr family transcriptional regulator [Staphylococcus simiae]